MHPYVCFLRGPWRVFGSSALPATRTMPFLLGSATFCTPAFSLHVLLSYTAHHPTCALPAPRTAFLSCCLLPACTARSHTFYLYCLLIWDCWLHTCLAGCYYVIDFTHLSLPFTSRPHTDTHHSPPTISCSTTLHTTTGYILHSTPIFCTPAYPALVHTCHHSTPVPTYSWDRLVLPVHVHTTTATPFYTFCVCVHTSHVRSTTTIQVWGSPACLVCLHTPAVPAGWSHHAPSCLPATTLPATTPQHYYLHTCTSLYALHTCHQRSTTAHYHHHTTAHLCIILQTGYMHTGVLPATHTYLPTYLGIRAFTPFSILHTPGLHITIPTVSCYHTHRSFYFYHSQFPIPFSYFGMDTTYLPFYHRSAAGTTYHPTHRPHSTLVLPTQFPTTPPFYLTTTCTFTGDLFILPQSPSHSTYFFHRFLQPTTTCPYGYDPDPHWVSLSLDPQS